MTRPSSPRLAKTRALFGEYPDSAQLLARVRRAVGRVGGGEQVVGRSVLGQPLSVFTLGSQVGPRVLLTSLVHGTEVVGGVALAHSVERLIDEGLHHGASFTVMPVVNPDALDENVRRVRTGRIASRRGNARGVDLNRNFPVQSAVRSRHPMAGSTHPLSPYFMGQHALSEPESRAVCDVADACVPHVSLSFHSFGERILYPYAHTKRMHPRAADYERLGRAWNDAIDTPYRVQSSASWYPVDGDLDDHLDARFGTLAMTCEVGNLDRRLLHPSRLVNPFSWMNPLDAERDASRVATGVAAMVRRVVLDDATALPLAAE